MDKYAHEDMLQTEDRPRSCLIKTCESRMEVIP
jgi:hypothetical protein